MFQVATGILKKFTENPSRMDYRREIDGLRALAILPVILFHAGFDTFSGGFVGVDVFFVISGYLITSIIFAEKEAGTFSLKNFYERRARRILPALFFVMAVCVLFAWLWLPPSDMRAFSQSLVAVSVFASNILFFHESGYFDTAAELKPLLHTWSLAVEEQYYVLFPLFIMLTWQLGKRWIAGLLIVVAVISLALAQWGAYNEPAAAFFLLPTRGWELAIGALTAFYLARRQQTNVSDGVRHAASGFGLLLILYAIFAFSRSTPFPSLYALVPTIGAALIILFATPTTVVGTVLGSKSFVGIGLVSYSAYLWHQPIFVFARHRGFVQQGTLTFLAFSIFALAIAYLTWRFVEQPFRRKEHFNGKVILVFSLTAAVLFIAFGAIGNQTDGFKGRFDFIRTTFPHYEFDNKKLQQNSWELLQSMAKDKKYGAENNNFDQSLWFSSNNKTIKVLIVGNSHSKDLFNAFSLNKQLFPDFEFARFGIQFRCFGREGGNKFYDSPNFKAADVIIASTIWGENRSCQGGESNDFDGLKNLISIGQRNRKLIVIASNTLEFPQTGSLTLADTMVFKSAIQATDASNKAKQNHLIQEINRRYFETKDSSEKVIRINKKLREMVNKYNLVYLDKEQFLCDSQKNECFGITEKFTKSFFDYGHYTLDGARIFGLRAYKIGWLKPIAESFQK